MKALFLCLAASFVILAWNQLRVREPVPDVAALEQRYADLSTSIQELSDQAASLPVHLHWSRVRQYVSLFGNIELIAAARSEELDYPHAAWAAKLIGPVLPVLAAAHGMQSLAPVHMKRLTVKDGHAELSLHVLGGAL